MPRLPLTDDVFQGVARVGNGNGANPEIWLVGSLDALRADGFAVDDRVLQDYLQIAATTLAVARVDPQSPDSREQSGAVHGEEVVPIQSPLHVAQALAKAKPVQPLLVPCTLSLPSLASLGALLPVGWTDDLVRRCRDVAGLRAWVAEQGAGLGTLAPGMQGDPAAQVGWLPLIVTARGILYGEAIAANSSTATLRTINPQVTDAHTNANTNTHTDAHTDAHIDTHTNANTDTHTDTHTDAHIDTHTGANTDANTDAVGSPQFPYRQPWHLDDRQRQQLYGVGRSLATALNLPWGVHLMQFCEYPRSSDAATVNPTPVTKGGEGTLVFDRLYPYPGPPVLASWGVQEPDLLSCHRACVLGQPLREVVIPEV
jgi:hypothetical protein